MTEVEQRTLIAENATAHERGYAAGLEAAAKAQECVDLVACIRSTTWGGTEEIVEMLRRRERHYRRALPSLSQSAPEVGRDENLIERLRADLVTVDGYRNEYLRRALAAEAEVKRLREAAQRVVNQVGPLIEAAAQSSVIQGTTDEAMVVLAVEYLSDLRAALSTATKEEGHD